MTDTGSELELTGIAKGFVFRQLLSAIIRRDAEPAASLLAGLKESEERWFTDLRRPTDEERENRIVHVVTPLFAAIVS